MKKTLSLILALVMLIGMLPQFILSVRAVEADSLSNLIDVGNPTKADASVWSYADGVWTMINSNYVNLRYDVELNKYDEVEFSFDATDISGKLNVTIRTLDNQFLASKVVVEDEKVVLRYTIPESGTYRFQICGVSDTSCAQVSNIAVLRINSDAVQDSTTDLINVEKPTSASDAVWSYADGIWTMTNSNYANLRYDVTLNAFDEIVFSFDAKVFSGKVRATIRTLDNQTLVSDTTAEDGTVILRYTVVESGTYRFQISGMSDTSCAEISNISVSYADEEDMSDYEQEAARVNTYIEQIDTDLSILLFADNHTYTRAKYKKYSSIMSQGVIDYQIGLGDFVDYSHVSKDVASIHLADCIQKAGKLPNCFYTYGNHDVGICGVNAGSTNLDVVMTPEENYAIFGAHLAGNKNVVVDANNPYGGYFYVDDEESKIRMIILNTSDIFQEENGTYSYIRYRSTLCVSQKQLTWFAEKALSFADKKTPSDWAVIVFGHEYNPYGGDLILFEILKAVQEGREFNKTTTVYRRLADNGDGTYGPDVDTVNGDTYSVDVDYSVQGPVTVMGFIHGHNHVDTQSVIWGINCIQVRCDNGNLDQYYIAPCENGLKGSYYFKDKNGHIYTFQCNEIPNAASIGYNNYWTSAKMTPAPISVFDEKGFRIASVSCKHSETIPEGAVEIAGFVAERDGSSVANESCEVLCIDKGAQTLTFVPYGTGTQRVISYVRAEQSAPIITKQPESMNVSIGEKYSVTVEAEGEGLTYQWYQKRAEETEFRLTDQVSNSYSGTMTLDMDGMQLYCVITDANGNAVTSDVATLTCTTEAYMPGDINGDGIVNNRDAARLLQYLAGWDVEVVEAALDANGDGNVNNRDAARILQYLAGWDVELH